MTQYALRCQCQRTGCACHDGDRARCDGVAIVVVTHVTDGKTVAVCEDCARRGLGERAFTMQKPQELVLA